MPNKFLFLAIVVGLAISLGLVFACGDDDDDDNDTYDDDVDDDADNLTCAEAFDYFYSDCGFYLEDNGEPIDVSAATAWCEDPDSPDWVQATYDCINENIGDCAAIETCYNEI